MGDEVVFTVVVRNNGPDDANNIQINDVLPASWEAHYLRKAVLVPREGFSTIIE